MSVQVENLEHNMAKLTIEVAAEELEKVNEKKRGRVSVKEKLAEFRELLGKDKNRERAREHQKDRGQSL